jgi:Domain of unknown function (DUF4317)
MSNKYCCNKRGAYKLKSKIQKKFEKNEIVFENFYYSYCKKNPNELAFSRVDAWDEVDEGLRKIFKEQLEHIIKINVNNKNFRGIFSDDILEINKNIKLPEGLELPENEKVLDILLKIVNENPSDEELQRLGDILSLKYLTAKFSRKSIYGLLTFRVEIEEVTHRFVFVTLCDLKENDENLRVDEVEKKLITEIIKNVFKKKRLTKGILYPYIDSESKEDSSVLLYDGDNESLYWTKAFECKTRLSRKEEKAAIIKLLSEQLVEDDTISSGVLGSFFECISSIKDIAITKEHWVKSIKEIKQTANDEKLKSNWDKFLKEPELTLTKETILSDYTIKMGEEIEVKVSPKKIKDVKQFVYNGKPYLVIKGNEEAKLEGVNKKLSHISWEQFKEILDNE